MKVEEARGFLLKKNFKQSLKMLKDVISATHKTSEIYLEAKFYTGVNYLDSDQPLLAIQEFSKLNSIRPDFKHLSYILLSIAYRRVN